MPYSFPNDLRQRIDLQLATGNFANEDEVLREAIGSLERRQSGLQALTQMVQEAEREISMGRIAEFDAEQTKEALRRRMHDEVHR